MSEERYLTRSDVELISEILENDTDAEVRHGQALLDMISARQNQGSAADRDFLDLLRQAHEAKASEGEDDQQ